MMVAPSGPSAEPLNVIGAGALACAEVEKFYYDEEGRSRLNFYVAGFLTGMNVAESLNTQTFRDVQFHDGSETHPLKLWRIVANGCTGQPGRPVVSVLHEAWAALPSESFK